MTFTVQKQRRGQDAVSAYRRML